MGTHICEWGLCGRLVQETNKRTGKSYIYCKPHRDGRKGTKHAYYLKNKKKCNERSRADWRDARRRFFEMYGNHCMCCGVEGEIFLALDHINGNGKEHRAKRSKIGVYKDALAKHQPDEYQVLCHNCNFAKYQMGKCPHSEYACLGR